MNQPHIPPHVHLDDQSRPFGAGQRNPSNSNLLQSYPWAVSLDWLVTETKALRDCDFPETVKVRTSEHHWLLSKDPLPLFSTPFNHINNLFKAVAPNPPNATIL